MLAHDGWSRAIVAPVLVGYLSHLAGDLLTPRGLRLAWPLKGTWALPLCRAGSPFEPLVVAALLVAAWCVAAAPQTRQGLLAATRVCPWAAPALPSLCSPSRRPRADPPRHGAGIAAARQPGRAQGLRRRRRASP